ncbi:hypothetical protein PG989_013790 [Apiospora arundinis]
MVHLASIPLELLHSVASLLLRPDQAALARTCKVLNGILTPIVWGDVELHFRGTHEGVNIDAQLGLEDDDEADYYENEAEYPFHDIAKEPSQRKYSQREFDEPEPESGGNSDQRNQRLPDGYEGPIIGMPERNRNRTDTQYGKDEKFCRTSYITSAPRWAELALHVQSLCMSVGVDDGFIRLLSDLRNLRSLELVGLPLPLEARCPGASPKIEMPALTNLKLRGYFPVAFLKEIFVNARTITHLNLGLLANKFDDKTYLRPYQGDSNHGDDEEEEDSMAFHSPIWLTDDLTRRFTSLTHLHLVKPYSGDTTIIIFYFCKTPPAYEKVIYDEWMRILEVSSGTLKEVILEHRLPVNDRCAMDRGNYVPERKKKRGGYEACPGDTMFCQTVLRQLLQQSERFDKLQHLALRGMRISRIPISDDGPSDPSSGLPSAGLHQNGQGNSGPYPVGPPWDEPGVKGVVPGIEGRPDNDELLRDAYPDCDVELAEAPYGIYPYDGHSYEGWEENHPKVPRQDDGDGLLDEYRYHRDYLQRYGPQWRIPN